MSVVYAQSYVDRACESRDVFAVYTIVRTLDAERNLAEPFKLFMHTWDWCCASRSGIWQYYERTPPQDFHEIAAMLDRCNLPEIAKRYRGGMENWHEPEYCGDLDDWINDNWEALECAAMSLIETDRQCLYPVPKKDFDVS